jgi:hypothetical protein
MKALWIIVFALLLAGSLLASAQKNPTKNPPSVNRAAGSLVGQIAVEIFIGRDKQVIRQYYTDHPDRLPPGLAARGGNLPPGLEKQLRRKGHLPPGLDKRIAAFPAELERQLAPLKPGLVRGVIQGQAVIFNPKTSLILDVFLIF